MRTTVFALTALCGLFTANAFSASVADRIDPVVAHDPGNNEEARAATTRIMDVLISDGLVSNDQAPKLRAEITRIFEKVPATTGDAGKDAAAQAKVRQQVQDAVVRHLGKDKSERVAELLAKEECWQAKACVKGKSCCAHH